jgi:hypothetical protein
MHRVQPLPPADVCNSLFASLRSGGRRDDVSGDSTAGRGGEAGTGDAEVMPAVTHQGAERGSQMDSSGPPMLSSARRKSSKRALPLRPPYVNT